MTYILESTSNGDYPLLAWDFIFLSYTISLENLVINIQRFMLLIGHVAGEGALSVQSPRGNGEGAGHHSSEEQRPEE